MEQKIEAVGVEIRKLHCMLTKNLELRVRAAGIDEVTLMHGWILRYLFENREHEVFQKDIEKYFSIGRSTVTGIIQIMEKNGYIRRESVKSDARLKKVVLTEKGFDNHYAMEQIVLELEEEILDGISLEELMLFYSVSRKIQKNLKKSIGKGEGEC